jgi:D-sedoheptulose 7-phosphate isomerase
MLLDEELAAHASVLAATVDESAAQVARIVDVLCASFGAGGKLLLCGNGGSAADAQHIAAEFVNRLHMDRDALPAIALTTDTSVLTCVANDASYEQVFSRQLQALGRAGDVLVGLSTSGRSPNVLACMSVGRTMGLTTIGFTGLSGAAYMAPCCDHLLVAASTDCARIQEAHGFLWHHIAGVVEERIFAA